MSRCKACDAMMKSQTAVIIDENGNRHEDDLCTVCRHVAKNPDMLDTKEFCLQFITEINPILNPSGLTPAIKLND